MMMKEEFDAVYLLCKKYGYGNVMQLASTLWRHDARANGTPESGCLVPTLPSALSGVYADMAKENELIYRDMYEKLYGIEVT